MNPRLPTESQDGPAVDFEVSSQNVDCDALHGVSLLWIPSPMPGLNELVRAKGLVKGKGPRKWSAYSQMKKRWSQDIAILARAQKFEVTGTHFTYTFFEAARNRDPSNLLGGIKVIEDALQELGLLENDGWQHVHSITPRWLVDRVSPGVLLATSSEPLTEAQHEEMLKLFGEQQCPSTTK